MTLGFSESVSLLIEKRHQRPKVNDLMPNAFSHKNVVTALTLIASGLAMALLFVALVQSQPASAQTPPAQTETPTATATPTIPPRLCFEDAEDGRQGSPRNPLLRHGRRQMGEQHQLDERRAAQRMARSQYEGWACYRYTSCTKQPHRHTPK